MLVLLNDAFLIWIIEFLDSVLRPVFFKTKSFGNWIYPLEVWGRGHLLC